MTRRGAAVYTMVHSDEIFLPQWIAYYERFFAPQDIYVIAQDTYGACGAFIDEGRKSGRFNVMAVHNDWIADLKWRTRIVQTFQYLLFLSHWKVMYNDVDEFVVTRPGSKWRDVGEYIDALQANAARTTGFNIIQNIHTEPPIDMNAPLLAQRRFVCPGSMYNKPILLTRPMEWASGFHDFAGDRAGDYAPDPDLLMLHLHYIDIDQLVARDARHPRTRWHPRVLANGDSAQNLPKDRAEWEAFYTTALYPAAQRDGMTTIPADWKTLL